MANAAPNTGHTELSADEQLRLAHACVKNRWLSRGIPPLDQETTPTEHFSFINSESLDSLREYFRSGSHGIREGVVFEGLAFVQQVNNGDEWLVLRHEFDPESGESYWEPFESYSFNRVAKSKARFECAIAALRERDAYDIESLLGNGQSRQRQAR